MSIILLTGKPLIVLTYLSTNSVVFYGCFHIIYNFKNWDIYLLKIRIGAFKLGN